MSRSPRQPSGRFTARLHRAVFSILFLAAMGLLVVLSQRYSVAWDWTASARNTLSAASVQLLERMPERIRVRAFVSTDARLREAIRQLLARYQRAHPHVVLEFVDPAREPRETERLGVREQGELVIEYRDRRENVRALTEAVLTTALARLARGATRWVAVSAGAGERDLLGGARRDLGQFAHHLEAVGLQARPLALGAIEAVPDNVAVLVLLGPRGAWPAQALQRVEAYLERGGNLLWLADPDGPPAPALAARLGVHPQAGMLVDPASRLQGEPSPEFIVVQGFASHPVSEGLDGFAAFPTATSLSWEAHAGWKVQGIAASGLRSWRETGDLQRAVSFDTPADEPGPLDVAVALRRPRSGGDEQRVLVFGDADFLSNAYLGLGSNRTLGSNALNWLSADDALVVIPVVMAPDLDYAPSQAARAIIALGAPVLLPVLLLATGFVRWLRRRHR